MGTDPARWAEIKAGHFNAAASLAFTANAVVAGALGQWLLRDAPPGLDTANALVLVSTTMHVGGLLFAAWVPMLRYLQISRDQRYGVLPAPRTGWFKLLAGSWLLFSVGVLVLMLSVLARWP